MTPPKARCFVCTKIIESHQPRTTNQRPRYCSPECREIWLKNPTCGRCYTKLYGIRSGVKFCNRCKGGCHACGKPTDTKEAPEDEKTKGRAKYLPGTYCSKKCRDWAWENQPKPACLICGEPVDFLPNVETWRDPPGMHHACRPDNRANLSQLVKERIERERENRPVFLKSFLPYIPFEHPPDPPGSDIADIVNDRAVDHALPPGWEAYTEYTWADAEDILWMNSTANEFAPHVRCMPLPAQTAKWSEMYHLEVKYEGPYAKNVVTYWESKLKDEAENQAELERLMSDEEDDDYDVDDDE